MENEEIIKLENRELPKDEYKNKKIAYDYKKRTQGGFIDAIFLGSIILTGTMWIAILLMLGSR